MNDSEITEIVQNFEESDLDDSKSGIKEISGVSGYSALKNNESTTRLIKILKQSSIQYKTLSKSEERELIQKYLSEGKTDELKQLLILHNVRAVFNIAKKYAMRTKSFDDMVAEGFRGLCIAAERFDFSRDIKFITFAYPWIFKYVVKEFYDAYETQIANKAISLNTGVTDHGLDNDNTKTTVENFIDTNVDPSYQNAILPIESQIENSEAKDIIHGIYDYLKTDNFEKHDFEIFKKHFENGESIRSISVDLDMKISDVNKRKSFIVNKLKSFIKDTYDITSAAEIFKSA